MYHFGTTNNDIYEQGVDEGRRQVLADLARMVKDSEEVDGVYTLNNDVRDYLSLEGYL